MTETNKIPEAAFSGVAQERPKTEPTPGNPVVGDRVNDTSTAQQVAELIKLGDVVVMDSEARVIIKGQYFVIIHEAGKKVVKIKILREKGWVVMTESTQGYPTVIDAITSRADEYMDNKRKLIAHAAALEKSHSKYNESLKIAEERFEELGEVAKEAMKTVEEIRKD